MDKKTVAVTVLTSLIVVFIVAIGATLSAFKVSKERVTVESISIVCADEASITDKNGNIIQNLEVKSSSVGVRPATGDEDTETNIPTTVNDAVGTEGAYASFFLNAPSAWEIRLQKCSLSKSEDINLDNVRLGIMEEKNDPVCGTDVGVVLARGDEVEKKEYVVVVWLDQETTKDIKGAKISVELELVLL